MGLLKTTLDKYYLLYRRKDSVAVSGIQMLQLYLEMETASYELILTRAKRMYNYHTLNLIAQQGDIKEPVCIYDPEFTSLIWVSPDFNSKSPVPLIFKALQTAQG